MEFWAGYVVCGRPVERDRAAEFTASGSVESLVDRVPAAKGQFRADIAELEPYAGPRGALRPGNDDHPQKRTQGGALLHVYEELAQHLGQMEISRDGFSCRGAHGDERRATGLTPRAAAERTRAWAAAASSRPGWLRAQPGWGCPRERALSSIPLSHTARRNRARRHRARRDPDAGEPLVRPLLRHACPGYAGFSVGPVLKQTVGGKTYPIFDQFGYEPGVGVTSSGYLQPFHLEERSAQRERADDQRHHPQLGSAAPELGLGSDGRVHHQLTWRRTATRTVPSTMGYFTRKDLAFYYALADAFTICDGYHCSVLGPTDPNRVMSISATIDPAGVAGGPCLVTQTSERQADYGTFTWTTMPEQLSAAGVSWKVYNDPTALFELSPFPTSRPSTSPRPRRRSRWPLRRSATRIRRSSHADVAAGTLPPVSWIMPPLAECEHPAAPPEYGEYLVQQILQTLVSNPDVWSQTVFIVVYDENGGFFDHVPPPTPPRGTDGEYLTVDPLPSDASGIAGP